jgi:cytoskeletal protein CcmA (bactofilin family)
MAQIVTQTGPSSGFRPLGIARKWLFLALPLVFFFIPTGARAAAPLDDEVVLGGSYTLGSGQTLQGNLLVFGGSATIEDGARVTGDVILFGGIVVIEGEVDGNVSATGGNLSLGSLAIIHGDVNMLGANIQQEEGSQILGEITIEGEVQTQTLRDSFAGRAIARVLDMLWSLFLLFAFSALAVLIVIFAPNPASRVAQSIVIQPGMSALVGLLTLVVALPVLLILAITILLSPVSFLGLLVLGIAAIFGWISLGLETGNRLAHTFNREWAPAVSAGLGTFLLTFVAFSLEYVFSWLCIGWIFPTAVGVVGLGAVVLSQFGRQVYQISGSNN